MCAIKGPLKGFREISRSFPGHVILRDDGHGLGHIFFDRWHPLSGHHDFREVESLRRLCRPHKAEEEGKDIVWFHVVSFRGLFISIIYIRERKENAYSGGSILPGEHSGKGAA